MMEGWDVQVHDICEIIEIESAAWVPSCICFATSLLISRFLIHIYSPKGWQKSNFTLFFPFLNALPSLEVMYLQFMDVLDKYMSSLVEWNECNEEQMNFIQKDITSLKSSISN